MLAPLLDGAFLGRRAAGTAHRHVAFLDDVLGTRARRYCRAARGLSRLPKNRFHMGRNLPEAPLH